MLGRILHAYLETHHQIAGLPLIKAGADAVEIMAGLLFSTNKYDGARFKEWLELIMLPFINAALLQLTSNSTGNFLTYVLLDFPRINFLTHTLTLLSIDPASALLHSQVSAPGAKTLAFPYRKTWLPPIVFSGY